MLSGRLVSGVFMIQSSIESSVVKGESVSGQSMFVVLVNDEEQYSLWPSGKDTPPGWRATEMHGTEEACMKWVDEVWTDMRPASLRAAMAAER
jgi:MbtH protein